MEVVGSYELYLYFTQPLAEAGVGDQVTFGISAMVGK